MTARAIATIRSELNEDTVERLELLGSATKADVVLMGELTYLSTPANVRKAAKLSYLPFQARATIETLLEFPALNATLEENEHTVYTDAVHLGIAVSLGSGGLIVPVIRDAQDLSVEGIGKRIKDLAVRARSNQLKPDEVSGGTFTITNPGPFGSIMATPVINLPQVGILDTEAVVKRPVVVTDELGNDSIAIRSMTYLCMSWDHRALDGNDASTSHPQILPSAARQAASKRRARASIDSSTVSRPSMRWRVRSPSQADWCNGAGTIWA